MIRLLATTALTPFVLGGMALAADLAVPRAPIMTTLPAVSGPNAEFGVLGGGIERNDTTGFDPVTLNRFRTNSGGFAAAFGSIALPVTHSVGVQFDAIGGTLGGRGFGGGAGHLFWRDPATGLLGIYASGLGLDRFGGTSIWRVGIEAEAYFGQFSISGTIGAEQVSGATRVFGVPANGLLLSGVNDKLRFYDMIDLNYYLTDNVRFSVGHRYIAGRNAAALGAEYAFEIAPGLQASVFGEGRIGEKDYMAGFGGVKVYFGGPASKPLIRRHREDDPPNRLMDDVMGASSPRRLRYVPGTGPVTAPPIVTPPPTCNCGPCYAT